MDTPPMEKIKKTGGQNPAVDKPSMVKPPMVKPPVIKAPMVKPPVIKAPRTDKTKLPAQSVTSKVISYCRSSEHKRTFHVQDNSSYQYSSVFKIMFPLRQIKH
ncbi:hypothetical protein ACJMK2_033174 [Sinanodonta woodiana]|uniref:Uncharacterized protein n=1 Tax=Sinanodonta woodiana TaxID=1069815 RepID=A0ABD3X7J7_SINWO